MGDIMFEWFSSLAPVWQALAASLFTWAMTAAGAAAVFFFGARNKNFVPWMLGIAAGVMTAASFWSLLLPAAEFCEELGFSASAVLTLGFSLGGACIFACNVIFARIRPKSEKKRALLLVFSVTLHNVPEGLCVGVAFGALAYGLPGASLMGALLLALGIGLQNFPEGAAISLPLAQSGLSCRRAFFWGQISGAVEPLAAVFGAMLVLWVRAFLPFALAFAAGAMIYVVASELFSGGEGRDITAIAAIVGFSVMMLMDTVF
jgi:ZIP family zinc transporter